MNKTNIGRREPALVIGTIVSVVVAVAAAAGIVIDADTLTSVVVSLLPVLTTLWARFFVSPAVKP